MAFLARVIERSVTKPTNSIESQGPRGLTKRTSFVNAVFENGRGLRQCGGHCLV